MLVEFPERGLHRQEAEVQSRIVYFWAFFVLKISQIFEVDRGVYLVYNKNRKSRGRNPFLRPEGT